MNEDSEILEPVLDSVGLKTLTGFSLRVRVHKNLTHPAQMETVEQLKRAADRVIQSGGDQLLLFDMASQNQKRNDSTGNSLFTLRADPLQLFRMIFALTEHRPYYDPPLQEVNLIFQRDQVSGNQAVGKIADQTGKEMEQPMLLLFDWLSDGEQSFLARMALFALFRAADLLILLDEPEVHFNDVWKREIVRTLDKIMRGYASHALITSHSSIALSDVPADDILVLRRTGRYTTSAASQSPGIQTFGADPSDILVHVFGTLSPNGEHSRNFIRRKIGESTTAEELNRLEEVVAPGYWRYRIQLEAHRLQRTLH